MITGRIGNLFILEIELSERAAIKPSYVRRRQSTSVADLLYQRGPIAMKLLKVGFRSAPLWICSPVVATASTKYDSR
jgi:hypothetical protein